ncbi:alpha-L-rhamnosidase [Asanoa ishikariensis]|uniref:alpha-L-rhamnosidase n=1 Tax=Asanoa ishikariensis TaxID=137265 RepID=A0A1H3UG91_9ACTN|nr:family 78 glycoside hydrolase catalytic domain [Asanoa ishikariensis]GIF63578.1 alpha-L-rhamnosidase [Asanoa ishikariensis]SDZ61502.1 alpha-L-rhamnosidase [Asanoa ishikariensis]
MVRTAAPTPVRFAHRTDDGTVLAVPSRTPSLSWQIPEAPAEFAAVAYELETTVDGDSPQTHLVDSPEQVLVPWPAAPIASRQRVTVRVRVRDTAGEWTDWSPAAHAEGGLFDQGDWTARFVSPRTLGAPDQPAPLLRGRLDVPGEITRARLYVTSHGLHRAELNGQRVGDDELAPGWTSYPHRLRYRAYDVTGLLKSGANTLDVALGNGWFRGRLGWRGGRALYGERLALLAQLEVTTADGRTHTLATDESWTAGETDVLANDNYDGQRTDLRRPARPADTTDAVDVLDADLGRLVAPEGPPVRVTEVLPAVAVSTSPSGRTLVDFGQNLVGWVRLRVRDLGAGKEVTIRHAEVLENGELGVRPLKTAKATDTYVLAGPDEVTLEPVFTFHGFRYAEISGVDSLEATDIEAVVVGTDLRRTGWFESSHPLLNRFHDNVVWSARGNFLDVPTDCPQRDERLGWTGDIQVFAPTATFLFDAAGFLTNWLADLAAEQYPDGSVPFVIPDVLRTERPAAAAWGDAATIVPWVIYQRTGDAGVLEKQFPSMRAWVDRLAGLAGKDCLWTGGFQFGDWLDPTAPPEAPAAAKADPDVIATAHLARSAELVAWAAAVLGDHDTEQHYADLAARTREAFAREYVTAGGRVISDAPTVYALALEWALLPGERERAGAGRRLADLVRTSGFRISTGFVGTPLIADALTSAGAVDVAHRLLMQTGVPSWLYAVTMDATTVWERWDSMLPDGRINPGEMTSFNHYALGAVADWLHRAVAGLAPAAPGYRKITVRPLPGPVLSSAAARHLTPYGEAAVGWQRADGRFTLTVRLPVGSRATVHLPDGSDPVEVGHGSHEFECADPYPRDQELAGDPTVRDVLDHEPTWAAVLALAAEFEVTGDDRDAAGRTLPYLDAPAIEVAEALAPAGLAPRAEAFRDRLAALLA